MSRTRSLSVVCITTLDPVCGGVMCDQVLPVGYSTHVLLHTVVYCPKSSVGTYCTSYYLTCVEERVHTGESNQRT